MPESPSTPQPAAAGPQQRKYRRLEANWVGRIRAKPTPTTFTQIGETRIINISQGGVFIETSLPLSKGTYVELDFKIPDKKVAVHAEGIVRWSSPHKTKDGPAGMGIEFTRVTTDDRSGLGKFLDEKIAGEAMLALTRDPLHQDLLRAYHKHQNSSVTTSSLEQTLGATPDAIWAALRTFTEFDLALLDAKKVRFVETENPHLRDALDEWIKKNK